MRLTPLRSLAIGTSLGLIFVFALWWRAAHTPPTVDLYGRHFYWQVHLDVRPSTTASQRLVRYRLTYTGTGVARDVRVEVEVPGVPAPVVKTQFPGPIAVGSTVTGPWELISPAPHSWPSATATLQWREVKPENAAAGGQGVTIELPLEAGAR